MSFRRPHRVEAVLVRKFRPLQQQPVAIADILALVAGEIEQAESDFLLPPSPVFSGTICPEVFVLVEDHFEST